MSKLTPCLDRAIRVKHLHQQDFLRFLLSEVVPLVSLVVMGVEIRPLELPPDMVTFHQVLVGYRAGVTEGERIVFDGVLDWAPDTVKRLATTTSTSTSRRNTVTAKGNSLLDNADPSLQEKPKFVG